MFEVRKIPVAIGMVSLVGVRIDKYPVGFGNYFDFANGLRCINMWAENLAHASKLYLEDSLIVVHVWREDKRQWAVVVDQRLPEGYTFDPPCFTGCNQPSKDLLTKMGSYYGWDKKDEFRKYTDPKNWYEERGWSYSDNGTIIKKDVNVKTRKLSAKWTVERSDDYFS